MRKAKVAKDTLRSEYERADFPGGLVRGKYAAHANAASNIVVLEPERVSVFPSSAAVNDALHAILKVAKPVAAQPQSDAPMNASRRRGND